MLDRRRGRDGVQPPLQTNPTAGGSAGQRVVIGSNDGQSSRNNAPRVHRPNGRQRRVLGAAARRQVHVVVNL